MNSDLETKLQQLESERTQYADREVVLTEQLQQLEAEKVKYADREVALTKQLQWLEAEGQAREDTDKDERYVYSFILLQ